MINRLKSLLLLILGLAVVLLALLYVLQLVTSNTVKERLEALLSERTGLTVTVNGEASWRYFWPTAVSFEDINGRNASGTEQWLADSLRLELKTLSILRAPRTPDNWNVSGIAIQQLRGHRSTEATPASVTDPVNDPAVDQYAIKEFRIDNLQPDQPAPFAATLRYRRSDAEPLDLELTGKLQFVANERRLRFEPAIVSGNLATGTCHANIALRQLNNTMDTQQQSVTSAPGIVSTDLWRRSDWDLSCALSALAINETTFKQVALTSNNLLGNSQSKLSLPMFFTGSAELNLSIDASAAQQDTQQNSPKWVITPIITNVASAGLLTWLRRSTGNDPAIPAWRGPVSIAGRIETVGNTAQIMIAAAKGELNLISNNGTLDLTRFKQKLAAPLDELAPLIGDAETIRNWPDLLEYLTLQGHWTPQDGRQLITGRLDNLLLDAVAELSADSAAAANTFTSSGTVTFSTAQAPQSLPVPPILEDLPLPITCGEATATPDCTLDAKASKQLLAEVLKGGGPAGLSKKIDDLIDDNVPEQYRRAARSLLEILGHSVGDDQAAELEDFLEEELDADLAEEPSEVIDNDLYQD